MDTKKINESFWLKIDTEYDVFDGADTFKISYFNDDTGVLTDIVPANFSEIIRTVSGKVATIASNTLKDSFEIIVNNGYTLESGDVFVDSFGNKHYIEKISNNILYLKTPLINDLSAGEILNEVGNTGIYRKEILFDTVGNYTIIIRNPEQGMGNVPISIKIVDENLDDAQNKLDIILSNGNNCKYKTFV